MQRHACGDLSCNSILVCWFQPSTDGVLIPLDERFPLQSRSPQMSGVYMAAMLCQRLFHFVQLASPGITSNALLELGISRYLAS